MILYGRALGLSHCESEDVLHDTFAAMMRSGVRPAQPEHYTMRGFRNRALNHKRSLWRRVRREFESRRWFERHPDETERERDAMRCLAELPRDQREVIVLKIWHGFTYDAIGALLAISPNTAAGKYRYGMAKMRVCLQRKYHENDQSLGKSMGILETSPPLGSA
jgi:RNA polymerase sigma factor (sigma-70 family)